LNCSYYVKAVCPATPSRSSTPYKFGRYRRFTGDTWYSHNAVSGCRGTQMWTRVVGGFCWPAKIGHGGRSRSVQLVADWYRRLDHCLRHVGPSGWITRRLTFLATVALATAEAVQSSTIIVSYVAVPTKDCYWGFLLRLTPLSFEILIIVM
jgi:hypothetical protein